MVWLGAVVGLLLELTSGLKIFDDSVLFDIQWLSHRQAPEDLLRAYAQPEGVDPERAVVMQSGAERYLCHLPEPKQESTQSEAPYLGKTPRQLLQGLYSARTCTYRIEMYWTYELCHGRYLLQYHEEKDAARRVKRQEYYLGQYLPDQVSEDEKDFDHMHPPRRKIEDQMLPYYPVRYIQGTICDINNKPRVATINYVCVPDAKNQIYSFDEISSCEYELVVLTPNLCTHPAFKFPAIPWTERQRSLLRSLSGNKNSCELEVWDAKHQFKRNLPKAQSTSIIKIGNTVMVVLKTKAEDEEEEEEEAEGEEEIRAHYQTTPATKAEPPKPVPMDPAIRTSFLQGDYCLYGGAGWWKHEYCHGRRVLQFHEDAKDKRQRIEIVLGKWNEATHLAWIRDKPHKRPMRVDGAVRQVRSDLIAELQIVLGKWDEATHLAWIRDKPHKRPMRVDGAVRQVSHLYTSGDTCDLTGKPRQVEVRLRCQDTKGHGNAVTLYLLEPKTCDYILGVESAMLCNLLQEADSETGLLPTV